MEKGCEDQALHIYRGQRKARKVLNNRQEEIDEEMERKRLKAKQEQQREEERHLAELRRQEENKRHMWQEKLDAELEATHKRLELEKDARSTTAKLPKLKIIPFKGTPTDRVRFANMFVT